MKLGFRIGRWWIKLQHRDAYQMFSERYHERTGTINKILGPIRMTARKNDGSKWFSIWRADDQFDGPK